MSESMTVPGCPWWPEPHEHLDSGATFGGMRFVTCPHHPRTPMFTIVSGPVTP